FACCFGGLAGLFGLLSLGGLTRLFGFATFALLRQFFLLAAQQFGLTAGIFFPARELFRVDHGRGRHDVGLGRRHHHLVVTLDECALLAHFHLNGARTTGGIRLLDLLRGLLDQRDLLALA